MKIPAKELQAAFDVCSVTPSDPVLESSQFIRISQDVKQLRLALTGALWTEATATATEGKGRWTTYVDRRALKAFLAATKSKEVELFYKDKLTLKGHNRLELAAHPHINGYEHWEPKQQFDLSKEIKDIITVSAKYIPEKPTMLPDVAAINFKMGYGILATDTLYLCGFFGVPIPADCYIPLTLAKFIADSPNGKLAVDSDGVGLALGHGYAYEPVSARLSKYPLKGCQAQLDSARKLPALATVEAEPLLAALKAAVPFLLDKAEVGTVAAQDKVVRLTVPLAKGKFEQAIPLTVRGALPEVKWVLKKAIPFVEFIAERKNALLQIAKPPGALVLRYTEGKKQYVYLSADLAKDDAHQPTR
jgi:hypothetical protein